MESRTFPVTPFLETSVIHNGVVLTLGLNPRVEETLLSSLVDPVTYEPISSNYLALIQIRRIGTSVDHTSSFCVQRYYDIRTLRSIVQTQTEPFEPFTKLRFSNQQIRSIQNYCKKRRRHKKRKRNKESRRTLPDVAQPRINLIDSENSAALLLDEWSYGEGRDSKMYRGRYLRQLKQYQKARRGPVRDFRRQYYPLNRTQRSR